MIQASWASTVPVMFKVSVVLAAQAQAVIPLYLLLGAAHLRQEFKKRGWVLWTWERLWVLSVLEQKSWGAGRSLGV